MMQACCVALSLLLLTGAAQADAHRRRPALGGALRLDLAAPIVVARIGDVHLRLRVDFDQRDSIELNPRAAASLPIPFEPGGDAEVGRVVLPGRMAIARMKIAGQEADIQLATHDRDCCGGADGTISAALLPFKLVELVGRNPVPAAERVYAMSYSKAAGLEITEPTPAGPIRIQFSLQRPGAIATKAGGAVLARAYGGRLDRAYSQILGPFGISRPVKMLALNQPAHLAGFSVQNVHVRTADFGGKRSFPGERAQPGEIVVRKRIRAHHDWPAILLGREFLGSCSEISFRPPTRTLGLRCPAVP